jgi:hypothetical protein
VLNEKQGRGNNQKRRKTALVRNRAIKKIKVAKERQGWRSTKERRRGRDERGGEGKG